jgi:hypothetical protein
MTTNNDVLIEIPKLKTVENLSVVEGDAILLMLKECIIYMMYQAEVKEEDIAMEQQAF